MWEVKLSSEDSQASLESEREEEPAVWNIKWCSPLHQRDVLRGDQMGRILRTGLPLQAHRRRHSQFPLVLHLALLHANHPLCWHVLSPAVSISWIRWQACFSSSLTFLSPLPTKWGSEKDSHPWVTLTHSLQCLSCSPEVRKPHIITLDPCLDPATLLGFACQPSGQIPPARRLMNC